MKIELLITHATLIGFSARVECDILKVNLLSCFLANSGRFHGRGATLRSGNLLLSPKTFLGSFNALKQNVIF